MADRDGATARRATGGTTGGTARGCEAAVVDPGPVAEHMWACFLILPSSNGKLLEIVLFLTWHIF